MTTVPAVVLVVAAVALVALIGLLVRHLRQPGNHDPVGTAYRRALAARGRTGPRRSGLRILWDRYTD